MNIFLSFAYFLIGAVVIALSLALEPPTPEYQLPSGLLGKFLMAMMIVTWPFFFIILIIKLLNYKRNE